LFGVIQTGSFNAAESADLFEIFKTTYVSARQKRIEWMINYMAKLGGYVGTVKLTDVMPLLIKETDANAVLDSTNPGVVDVAAVNVSKCKHDSFSNEEIKIFEEFGESKDDYIVLGTVPIEWNTPHDEVMKRHDQLFDKIGEITLTPGGKGK
jgi:hypothetical protein